MTSTAHAARLTLAVSLASLIAACNHAGTASPQYIDATYSCERGAPLRVRFFTGQETAELERGGETFSLPQQRTASGFYYTNGKMGIRGKGEELLLEIGRMAPVRCTAQ